MKMGFLDFLDNLVGGRNTLYFAGCMERYVYPEISENYKKIISKCGIEFIQLDELCCGSPAISGGYSEDAKLLATKNYSLFKNHGVGRIITSCPACFSTLTKYAEILPKSNKKIKVEHSTVVIVDAIKRGKLKLKNVGNGEKVTIHDPCHLKHYNMFEETREILKAIGYTVGEMERSKDNSFCCGGGGGLRSNFPKISKEISKERSKEINSKFKTVITTCPLCYAQLKEFCNCIELSQVIINAI